MVVYKAFLNFKVNILIKLLNYNDTVKNKLKLKRKFMYSFIW